MLHLHSLPFNILDLLPYLLCGHKSEVYGNQICSLILQSAQCFGRVDSYYLETGLSKPCVSLIVCDDTKKPYDHSPPETWHAASKLNHTTDLHIFFLPLYASIQQNLRLSLSALRNLRPAA